VKLPLDQHLSRKLVPSLQTAFSGSSHVIHHGLDKRDDDAVWAFAKQHQFAIATKDEDFQVLSFVRGHPPKVVWIRSGNGPSKLVLDLLLRARLMLEEFEADADRSLLILP